MWRWRSLSILCLVALFALVTTGGAAQSKTNLTSLLNWKPPKGWHAKFPYYISGFDHDGRPVFIWEFGNWDIRKISSQSRDSAEAAGKYMEQLAQIGIQMASAFEEEGGITVLADLQGFNISQLVHLPTAQVFLRFAPFAVPWEAAMNRAVAFNVNYAGQRLFAFLQPFIGALIGKADILGTNKERWIPKLLEEIPKSQLPPWYGGGNKTWKPVQVLGTGQPVDLELLKKKSAEFMELSYI